MDMDIWFDLIWLVEHRYKKSFYRIKLRTVLACAIMGFYKHNIDQTNFGLIWKVELFLKPKVFTGTPISIVKLDLPILPYMGTNMGMLPPSISFSISNNLILTSFIFTFKLNINFNFTFELRNKNKKNNVFFGGQKKTKKNTFFFQKKRLVFFDLQH